MKLKINWKSPVTELEHVVLTMLLWHDIWRNDYSCKSRSKYIRYAKGFIHYCPLCKMYKVDCDACFLDNCNEPESAFALWGSCYDRQHHAKKIYLACKREAKELIKIKKTCTL